jgi:outer membrane protein assembly factor BamB
MSLAHRASVLVLTATSACSAVATPNSASEAVSPTPSPMPNPLPEGVAQVVDFGETVWGVASIGDTIWVEGDNTLHQLDGATGEELKSMPGLVPTITGGTLRYLRDGKLVEADPLTGEERRTYKPAVLGTTVSDGILWAADDETDKLLRIELETGKVLGKLTLPSGEVKRIVPWEGAIWVVVDGANIVLRIDPRTGKVTDKVKTGNRPHSVAIGFGSLWVIEHGADEVLRLEPRHGRIEARITGPGVNVAIAIGGDYVWASSQNGIMKIDPATNQVVEELELGYGELYGMAVSQGSLWVTTGGHSAGIYQVPMW